jgi:hypothetical protein
LTSIKLEIIHLQLKKPLENKNHPVSVIKVDGDALPVLFVWPELFTPASSFLWNANTLMNIISLGVWSSIGLFKMIIELNSLGFGLLKN